MRDSNLITSFLVSSEVAKKDAGLVAEMIHTVESFVSASESTFSSLMWPDKSGRDRILLKSQDINKILSRRERVLLGVSEGDRANEFRVYVDKQRKAQQLTNFLSVFTDSGEAAQIAAKVGSLDDLVAMYRVDQLSQLGLIRSGTQEKLAPVLNYSVSTESPALTLQVLASEREGYSQAVRVIAFANKITQNYTDFDIRRFTANLSATATLSSWETCSANVRAAIAQSVQGNQVDAVFNIAYRCHSLFSNPLTSPERRVAFVFISALETVLTDSAPRMVTESIRSTHPFLVRPLFRSYPDALVFAMGGKLASSLETIWGSRGEDLFLALGPDLRPVRNGGIDVVKGRNAYDVKSGPAVMNKDQVDILHIKQDIIQQGKRVPGLDTFKVALVYGREDAAFGTMAPDIRAGNILPARRAWEELTDDALAPERIYAIAGLIADLVGVPNSIAAVTTNAPVNTHLSDEEINTYDEEFSRIFDNAFDPPAIKTAESLKRLEIIEATSKQVRYLL